MKITRYCAISRSMNSMEIDITPEALAAGEERHGFGELIQNCFPQLSAGEREFLITGIPPHMWDMIFGSNQLHNEQIED